MFNNQKISLDFTKRLSAHLENTGGAAVAKLMAQLLKKMAVAYKKSSGMYKKDATKRGYDPELAEYAEIFALEASLMAEVAETMKIVEKTSSRMFDRKPALPVKPRRR